MSEAKLKERNGNAWWQVTVLCKTHTAEGRERTQSTNVAVKCADAEEAIRNALAYSGRWEFSAVWCESVRRLWMDGALVDEGHGEGAPWWWVKAVTDGTGMNVTTYATYLAKAQTARLAIDTVEDCRREQGKGTEITCVNLSREDPVIAG